MFYSILTLIFSIFTLGSLLSILSNTPLQEYPFFKKVKITTTLNIYAI